MPVAANIPVTVYRGDSPVIPYQLTNTANPTGIDITGYVFELTVDSIEEPTNDSTEVFTVAGVITEASEGRFGFQPTVADLSIAPGDYFYDISLVNGTEQVTIIKSTFTVRQDIGKA